MGARKDRGLGYLPELQKSQPCIPALCANTGVLSHGLNLGLLVTAARQLSYLQFFHEKEMAGALTWKSLQKKTQHHLERLHCQGL